mmetsp:Transcript_81157/g.233235  ORF Transcript_81157/g.233235 Transcript_81157/m.233235 type:complete len:227 (+) Transcript_81157:1084-1764(+)
MLSTCPPTVQLCRLVRNHRKAIQLGGPRASGSSTTCQTTGTPSTSATTLRRRRGPTRRSCSLQRARTRAPLGRPPSVFEALAAASFEVDSHRVDDDVKFCYCNQCLSTLVSRASLPRGRRQYCQRGASGCEPPRNCTACRVRSVFLLASPRQLCGCDISVTRNMAPICRYLATGLSRGDDLWTSRVAVHSPSPEFRCRCWHRGSCGSRLVQMLVSRHSDTEVGRTR